MTMNLGGILQNTLGTIARGFLLGVGFSIAVGILYAIAWPALDAEMNHRMKELRSSLQASSKDIVLSGIEEQKHDGIIAITGRATNTGKNPAYEVRIQANLFNHGKFVDQYSTHLSGGLAPSESQYFKVSCGCSDKPPAGHDSVKAEVISEFLP